MEEARPVSFQLLRMPRRSVALMTFEPVAGGEAIIEDHQRITQHLGHDGGAANDVAALIAAHEGAARNGGGRGHRAVDERQIRDDGELSNRHAHGVERGVEDIPLIDEVRAHDAESDVGVGLDDLKGAGALARGEPLGIIDADRKMFAVQHDGGCHHRTGPRASSGFIDSSNPQRTVEEPLTIAGDRAMGGYLRKNWGRREKLVGRR